MLYNLYETTKTSLLKPGQKWATCIMSAFTGRKAIWFDKRTIFEQNPVEPVEIKKTGL